MEKFKMKKYILFLLVIVFSFSSAFASTDISYIIKDENGYYFAIGTTDINATDAGVIVNGEKLSLKNGKLYNPGLPEIFWNEATSSENAFNSAINNNGNFGMGFKSSKDFKIIPYVTGEDGTDTLSEGIEIYSDISSGVYTKSPPVLS